MRDKIIITSGKMYADIDVISCLSAYKQLINLSGKAAQAITTGPWNQTVPNRIRALTITIDNAFLENPTSCNFCLMDISNFQFVENFVILDQVIEVFDHHHGYEKFWQEKLSCGCHIEPVGACATLIWEMFKKQDQIKNISPVNALLLYTAIFANTLNFKSQVTTLRDIKASEELNQKIKISSDWKEKYYQEVAQGFEKDLIKYLKQDTKIVRLSGKDIFFSQIEMWKIKKIIQNFPHPFFKEKKNGSWLINIVGIEEGKSYIFSNDPLLIEELQKIIPGKMKDNYFVLDQLWLRKELLKRFSEAKIFEMR